MTILFISSAPVLIILFYIYFRDKYEKEPVKMLVASLLMGMFITVPVLFAEGFLKSLGQGYQGQSQHLYTAFVVAAFTEELFKFLALWILIWRSKAFNEKFDGIVYAVFISLGFALVENVFYVMDGGVQVGLVRAITAVPAHALFGVFMGYYFGKARFFPKKRRWYMLLALLMPLVFHGMYDYFLMSQLVVLLILFLPFLIFLWIFGFRRIKILSDASVFRIIRKKSK